MTGNLVGYITSDLGNKWIFNIDSIATVSKSSTEVDNVETYVWTGDGLGSIDYRSNMFGYHISHHLQVDARVIFPGHPYDLGFSTFTSTLRSTWP